MSGIGSGVSAAALPSYQEPCLSGAWLITPSPLPLCPAV